MSDELFGVGVNEDLKPGLLDKDVRPFGERFGESLSKHGGFALILIGLLTAAMPFIQLLPNLPEAGFVCGLICALFMRRKTAEFPFRTPPYRSKDKDAGLYFLGSGRSDGRSSWFSKADMTTHMLVFGSTGSGKTIFLLSLLYQALITGSGVLYVDGKADNSVFWMMYALVRRLGREDDVLVINYLTGGLRPVGVDDEGAEKEFGRRSNTTNPLADVAAEQARSLMVGLMRETSGDGEMWKGRASAMLGALLKALCVMRDREEIVLDVEQVRKHMPLDQLVELSKRKDIPEVAIVPLCQYLAELPGFSQKEVEAGKPIGPKAYEQHNFLTMQLTEVMGDMTDTFQHIFSVSHGEVDFRDVVFNRRILFVMLPALEADPDRLAGLGKLIVAGIRSALGPALGAEIEGHRKQVIEQKPTAAQHPFLMILDEYGYYSVRGFATVAAQARSLGVSVVFAGQDYPSFQRSDKLEAASTIANTNIKVAMKIEDPDETFKVIQDRGGEARVSSQTGFERKKGGLSSAFKGKSDTSVSERKRINLRDLVTQGVGQAHVINGDRIERVNLCYVRPEFVGETLSEASLNKFIRVFAPNRQEQAELRKRYTGLSTLLDAHGQPQPSSAPTAPDIDVERVLHDFEMAVDEGLPAFSASRYAAGMIGYRERLSRARLDDEDEDEAPDELPGRDDFALPRDEFAGPGTAAGARGRARAGSPSRGSGPRRDLDEFSGGPTSRSRMPPGAGVPGGAARRMPPGGLPGGDEDVSEEMLRRARRQAAMDGRNMGEGHRGAEFGGASAERGRLGGIGPMERPFRSDMEREHARQRGRPLTEEETARLDPRAMFEEEHGVGTPEERKQDASAAMERLEKTVSYPPEGDKRPSKIGELDVKRRMDKLLRSVEQASSAA